MGVGGWGRRGWGDGEVGRWGKKRVGRWGEKSFEFCRLSTGYTQVYEPQL
uniref:Uncharacterized protein n=1 Tax=Desertifilum tharense IPPAS B-1220 TaxID=1781255 RepID=A0ACD5GPH1_9CYAN